MKLIPLTQGKFAMVDDGDYEELAKHKWHFKVKDGAIRNITIAKGKQKKIYMHRIVMEMAGIVIPVGKIVDHHDRDKCNNQRSNLRLATNTQNQWNSKISSKNTSGAKGVCQDKGRWRADIRLDGKRKFLGYFPTKEEAVARYREEANTHYGEGYAI